MKIVNFICLGLILTSTQIHAKNFADLAPNGTLEDIKSALRAGANINEGRVIPGCSDCSGAGSTALMFASSSRNSNIVKFLIESGAAVNIKNKEGETALHAAALRNKDPEIINILIKAGAKLEVRAGYFQTTPLAVAVSNNSLKVVMALIKAGANIETVDKFGKNLVFESASNENPDVFNYIIKKLKKDINEKHDGSTVLLTAAKWNNNPDMIKNMLKMGSNINALDKGGRNALMLAATKKKNSRILSAFLKKGIDINSQDKNGNTALLYASGYGRSSSEELPIENVEFLLKNGADLSILNGAGYTALDAANMYHSHDDGQENSSLEKLLEKTIEEKDLFKNTPTFKTVFNAVKLNPSLSSKCKGFSTRNMRLIKKGKFNKGKNYWPFKIIIGCNRKRNNFSIKVFYDEDFSEWSAKVLK